MPETARGGRESPASGAAQGTARGAIPIWGVVRLLASVAAVSLVTIGILAVAAATGAESLFNFIAWLIPSIGVGFSLVIALVGTGIALRIIKDQASGADQARQAAGRDTEQVGQIAGQAQNTAGQAVDQVTDTAGQAVDEVTDTAGQATQGVQDTAEGVAQQAHDAAGQAQQQAAQGAQDTAGQAAGQAQDAAGQAQDLNITDAARQKAEELGVDLSQVEGTGAEGTILARDVMEAANKQ